MANDPPKSESARLVALLKDNIFPLIVGIVGAAGLLAAIGGISVWARFFAAEVPQDQAVDAVTDPELIVTGAVSAVVFVIGGLLVVAFAYVVDRNGRQTEGMARTLLGLAVMGGLIVCVLAEENEWWKVLLAAAAVVATGLLVWFWIFKKHKNDKNDKDDKYDTDDKDDKHDKHDKGFVKPSGKVPSGPGEYDGPWHSSWGDDPEEPPDRFLLNVKGRFVLAGVAVLGAILVGFLLGKGLLLDRILWAIAILVVVGLLWACYAVAYSTGITFVWYGLSLFLAVLLFGTYLALADVAIHQRVQPVAVIRDNDHPGQGVLGIYIAETSDRLYLATVTMGCDEKRIRKDSGRLLWVSRDDIRAVSIGRLQDADQAADDPPEMLRDLWTAQIPYGNKKSQTKPPGDESAGGVTPTRQATELDDESDPGDSPRAAEDLREPAPAVLRAPKINEVSAVNEKGKRVARARPGNLVTVKGDDFGANPTVTVDDVGVGKLEKPHSDSVIKFKVPGLAESGRVEVRCGKTDPQELVVVPRPLPVVVTARQLSSKRVRLAARPARDRGELRYRWSFPGGREKKQRTIIERMPRSRRLRVRLAVSDDDRPRGAWDVSVRTRAGAARPDVHQKRRRSSG